MEIKLKENTFNEMNPIITSLVITILIGLTISFVYLINFFQVNLTNSNHQIYANLLTFLIMFIILRKNIKLEKIEFKKRDLKTLSLGITILMLMITVIALSLKELNPVKISTPLVSLDYLTNLVILLVLAPLLETMILCYLSKNLKRQFSDFISLIVPVVCFIANHYSTITFKSSITLLIGGIIMVYLFIKTSNIYYPILIHFIWNLLSFINNNIYIYKGAMSVKIFCLSLLIISLAMSIFTFIKKSDT